MTNCYQPANAKHPVQVSDKTLVVVPTCKCKAHPVQMFDKTLWYQPANAKHPVQMIHETLMVPASRHKTHLVQMFDTTLVVPADTKYTLCRCLTHLL